MFMAVVFLLSVLARLTSVASTQHQAWPDPGSFDHVLPAADADVARRRRNCSVTHLLASALDPPRCLPTFFVLGAQKAGTSSLAHWMAQHPQVEHPKTKELVFFSRGLGELNQGASASAPQCPPSPKAFKLYLTSFPRVSPEQSRGALGKVTGEWSPTYLPCPCCPAAMREVLPRARLVAVLRHPLERAFSRYAEQITERVLLFQQEVSLRAHS
jgi:hypothetical protein